MQGRTRRIAPHRSPATEGWFLPSGPVPLSRRPCPADPFGCREQKESRGPKDCREYANRRGREDAGRAVVGLPAEDCSRTDRSSPASVIYCVQPVCRRRDARLHSASQPDSVASPDDDETSLAGTRSHTARRRRVRPGQRRVCPERGVPLCRRERSTSVHQCEGGHRGQEVHGHHPRGVGGPCARRGYAATTGIGSTRVSRPQQFGSPCQFPSCGSGHAAGARRQSPEDPRGRTRPGRAVARTGPAGSDRAGHAVPAYAGRRGRSGAIAAGCGGSPRTQYRGDQERALEHPVGPLAGGGAPRGARARAVV